MLYQFRVRLRFQLESASQITAFLPKDAVFRRVVENTKGYSHCHLLRLRRITMKALHSSLIRFVSTDVLALRCAPPLQWLHAARYNVGKCYLYADQPISCFQDLRARTPIRFVPRLSEQAAHGLDRLRGKLAFFLQPVHLGDELFTPSNNRFYMNT